MPSGRRGFSCGISTLQRTWAKLAQQSGRAATITDIFLSYNRADQEVARCFAQGFTSAGLDVWWDVTLRSGEAYDEVTEAALRSAGAVVVLWSPRSVGSRWVRAEATVAERSGTLMPCLVEPCERPVMFELVQTADLCGWSGDTQDPRWQSFCSDVRNLLRTSGSKSGEEERGSAGSDRQQLLSDSGKASLALDNFEVAEGNSSLQSFANGVVEEFETTMDRYLYVTTFEAQSASARYLVDASIRSAGRTVRISARLTRKADGLRVWAERLEGKLADDFSEQERIGGALAAGIAQAIEDAELTAAKSGPDDNLSPYHLMLLALSAVREFNADGIERAINLIERGLEIAPEDPYLLSLGSLAYGLTIGLQWRSPDMFEASAERAQELSRRAVRQRANDPQVLGWAAVGSMSSRGDKASIDAMLDHAVERNPGWSYLWHFSAVAKMYRGDFKEAERRSRKALQLNPLSPDRSFMLLSLGQAILVQGDASSAIPYLEESHALLPFHPDVLLSLITAYQVVGEPQKAEKLLPEAEQFDLEFTALSYSDPEFVKRALEAYRVTKASAGN